MDERSPEADSHALTGQARTGYDSAIPRALAQNLLTGWAPERPLDPSAAEVAPYAAKRRAALSAMMPGEALVMASGTPKMRANDTDFRFRGDSDYVWLTGDTEPDGVLILRPAAGGHDAVLFVPERTARDSIDFFADRTAGELWVGRRPDPRETSARFGLECRPLRELEPALRELGRARIRRGVDPRVDAWCPVADPAADRELKVVLDELRLLKDDWEISQLQAASEATARGFADTLREREPALEYGERWLEGTFWRRARVEGNDVGYSSIVAAGSHATVLHWTRDDGAVQQDDLLLLDMGVELTTLYTADVTRTVPMSGRYTSDQRAVHDLVAAAQRAGLAAVRPGASFLAPNEAAMRVLAQGLADWNLLGVSVDEALGADPDSAGAGLHRRYTLHNISHMLGLDVHDCALAPSARYRDGTLVPGMTLTVEPGLYFQPDDLTVPPSLRGLGVRIEDDVVVTSTGSRVLSDQLPTDATALEAWLASLG